MTAILFDGDDQKYLDWINSNKRGLVINIRRQFDPAYVVLHRATCPHITNYPRMDAKPGGFTERSYLKLCGDTVDDIRLLLRRALAHQNGFSKECEHCRPI